MMEEEHCCHSVEISQIVKHGYCCWQSIHHGRHDIFVLEREIDECCSQSYNTIRLGICVCVCVVCEPAMIHIPMSYY